MRYLCLALNSIKGNNLKIKIMEQKQRVTYAFIDSQNLNYGTCKDIVKNNILIYKGWKLDFKKFRCYLTDKFKVSKAFIFIGYIKKNTHLYGYLRRVVMSLFLNQQCEMGQEIQKATLMLKWSFIQ